MDLLRLLLDGTHGATAAAATDCVYVHARCSCPNHPPRRPNVPHAANHMALHVVARA